MNRPMKTTGSPGPQMSDDVIALIVVAIFFGGPVLAMVAGAGDGLANWLVDRGVLTRTDVLVDLTAGAGLDLARSFIVGGLLLAVVAAALRIAQRRKAVDR